MQVVRFIKTHAPYQIGETAGFDDAKANALIRMGIAERFCENRMVDTGEHRRGRPGRKPKNRMFDAGR